MPAETTSQPIYRKDYSPPDYNIPHLDLVVKLGDVTGETTVEASMQLQCNPALGKTNADLQLDADRSMLTLQSMSVDGRDIALSDLNIQTESITVPFELLGISDAEQTVELKLTVTEVPHANKALSGLYTDGNGDFMTQMEADGFRRFCPFLDRPDVLATMNCRVEGNKATHPVLLSNGNYDSSGDLEDGRHYVSFVDPVPKPAYLFAVVAANMHHLEDTYTKPNGDVMTLRVYAAESDLPRCKFALASLKRAIHWDWQVYSFVHAHNRLDIVCSSAFNMGAMENTTLNIFNTKYVLADAATATDLDFELVEDVVAHEAFHTFTGNRVTLRAWFELTLKEGLTVFRDQEYACDRFSRATKRIEDVTVLRAAQFAEDAGPMAHPIRPNSYLAINNFYSATVYNKGAEIIRAAATILGPAAFKTATRAYLARHDGTAITAEDWINVLEDALVAQRGDDIPWSFELPETWDETWEANQGNWTGPGKEVKHTGEWGGLPVLQDRKNGPLALFRMWYTTAGTPVLTWRGEWDAKQGTYTLHVKQEVPATADAPGIAKPALHIPVRVGLLGADGKDLPLELEEGAAATGDVNDNLYGTGLPGTLSGVGLQAGQAYGKSNVVLHLTAKEQSFKFVNLAKPTQDAVDAARTAKASAPGAQPYMSDEQLAECPLVPSLLRGFSAPVRVRREGDAEREMADRVFRMAFDADNFNRFDSAVALSTELILSYLDPEAPTESPLASAFVGATRALLTDPGMDKQVTANVLDLPPVKTLLQDAVQMHGAVDPRAVAAARRRVRALLARELAPEMQFAMRKCAEVLGDSDHAGEYEYLQELSHKSARSLRGACLKCLLQGQTEGTLEGLPAGEEDVDPVAVATRLCTNAKNLSDAMVALGALGVLPADHDARKQAFQRFFDDRAGVDLVCNKWFVAQATSADIETIRHLTTLPAFLNFEQPNKVYSVVGGLTNNAKAFHNIDGSGYDFLMHVVTTLDGSNPHVAARMARGFDIVAQLVPALRNVAKPRIEAAVARGMKSDDNADGLSRDSYEVLSRALASITAAEERDAASA